MSIAQQPDASIHYRRHRKAVDALLVSIAYGLTEFDAEQATRPTDWGYVGTVAAWRNDLQEIADALKRLGVGR